MSWKVKRYHDISCGHRVHGHESKCAHFHGHNYRIIFICESDTLDKLGRVIDFSQIKSRLCAWVEEVWDHKFLIWDKDPAAQALLKLDPVGVLLVSFNPTAENMARHLVETVAPFRLDGTGIRLTSCEVEETRKCTAIYQE